MINTSKGVSEKLGLYGYWPLVEINVILMRQKMISNDYHVNLNE